MKSIPTNNSENILTSDEIEEILKKLEEEAVITKGLTVSEGVSQTQETEKAFNRLFA
jgi:phosphoribosylamine-glycine ligase